MTDAWPKKRRAKRNIELRKISLAKKFFELLDPLGINPMLGTRHAAENSYCLWCEPKGYDHWKDQQEHAPDCPFVAVMAEAGELFK